MPQVPIKCAGAPQKIMYLAEVVKEKNIQPLYSHKILGVDSKHKKAIGPGRSHVKIGIQTMP